MAKYLCGECSHKKTCVDACAYLAEEVIEEFNERDYDHQRTYEQFSYLFHKSGDSSEETERFTRRICSVLEHCSSNP